MRNALMISLLGFAIVLAGCSTGAKLRGQAMEIQSINKTIHDRAYNCAPKQLAFAESNVEFGLYELGEGDFVAAREHLMLAEQNAKLADKMSDHDACRDQQVAMVVKKAPSLPEDKDGDGILDKDDQCPLDPEDFDTYQDEDGCPDLDNDSDGIPDLNDVCLFRAEDVDGYQDEDGCPELDNELDGIADLNDQCPTKPEDFDGYQDDDGCPDNDNDDDNIADLMDECPMEPEVYNGNKDEDGCPDKEALAQIDGDKIKLNQKVFFKTGKADILSQSFPLLNEVAQILNDNQKIQIRIEGHTDSRGSNRSNQKLSDRRAASVRTYLMQQGVSSDRMNSVGYGEDKPIEDNSTESGRAANRRVEIHITSQ